MNIEDYDVGAFVSAVTHYEVTLEIAPIIDAENPKRFVQHYLNSLPAEQQGMVRAYLEFKQSIREEIARGMGRK